MTDPVALRRDLLTSGPLAFTAGFVDVVGFVALFGLFTAHVTGNFVLIGAELTSASSRGVLGKLLALPMFIIAVAGTRLAVLRFARDGRAPLRPLLVIQGLLLAAFMATGLVARPVRDPDALVVIVAGLLGVAAMGVQNAKARLVLGAQSPTTIMTGNTTQIVIDLVDLVCANPGPKAAARDRLARMGPTLLAFAVGTAAGAIGYVQLSFWCLLAPIAAVTLLAATAPGRATP